MTLVDTSYLEKKLNKVKIIDCSWHMPQSKRNGFEEYKLNHIPNAIFFDLDKNSKIDTDLPHMLVDKKSWEEIVSNMGIQNDDEIIIYDNSDVISSCRCWYNFIYFGHNPKLVHVLDGGFKKWNIEKKIVTNQINKITKSNYKAEENNSLVKDKNFIDKNITTEKYKVVDARSRERFSGKVPEPRQGLRSGSIPKSTCIPFNELINEDHTFKSKLEISQIFKSNLIETNSSNVIFSCGSGVTACVLALAYSQINDNYMPNIYDGSWAEYGKIQK